MCRVEVHLGSWEKGEDISMINGFIRHLSFIMANLRYPAKKGTNLSWLVDNPIDSKKLKDEFLPI